MSRLVAPSIDTARNRPSMLMRRCLLAAILLAQGATMAGLAAAAQPKARSGRRPRDVSVFRASHDERQRKFALALEELAQSCEDKGLAEPALGIRHLAKPIGTSELRLDDLPRQVQKPLASDLPPDEHFWRAQLAQARHDYARDLYQLSRQALSAGHVGYAFDLVREVLRHDSDHGSARRILGYVRNGDSWMSAFEAEMARSKKVWHDQFGWLPRDHVERYEGGERNFKGRWLSAAKEAELRRDFSSAWEIRTEHYLVKTNHSLERGVELARRLEEFYTVFYQLMAGFFTNPEQVQQLVAGSSARPRSRPKPHVVHYYRTRDEYLQILRNETDQPIEITKGIFFPRNGIAYFYFDPESTDDSTLFHEATHQLLSGSRPQTGDVGVLSDFWAIEGIACYMESFRRLGDQWVAGDAGHPRIQAARANLLGDGYFVPLEDFCRMGMKAFQTAKEIRRNYSQGAALVHFFMHYDGGRYREPFIEYLSQIYSAQKLTREHPEALAELTGLDATDLDQQYREYIEALVPGPPAEANPQPAAGGAAGP